MEIEELISKYEGTILKLTEGKQFLLDNPFSEYQKAWDEIYEHTYKLQYAYLEEILETDTRLIATLLKTYHQNHQLDFMVGLLDNVRALGLLYNHEQNAFFNQKDYLSLAKLILKISIDLIRNPLIFSNEIISQCIHTIYDIIFHHINFEEIPEQYSKLLFTLISETLDEKFHILLNNSLTKWNYGQIIYFVEMTSAWFEHQEEEYLVILKKLKPLLNTLTLKNDKLTEWQELYQRISSRQKPE